MSDLVHPWRYEGSKLVCGYCKVAKKEYEMLTDNAKQSLDGRCLAFQTQYVKAKSEMDKTAVMQLDLFLWKANQEVK